ncbi:glycine cleavage system protein GcvH [Spirillospora sp. CA-255316]
MNLPENLSYTSDHEWIDIPPGSDAAPPGEVRIGLSAVAVESLGEIVFVDLPPAGTELTAGEPCGEVESTKTVSEVFSPVTGTVGTVNPGLADNPSLVNEDPYGQGWLFTAVVTQLGEVLDASGYRAMNEG